MGAFLLFFFGRRANKDHYEKRILVIFGGGIGDVVKRSVICGYIHAYLKEYDVYYLMPYRMKLPYAKETICFDYNKAKIDPIYYFNTVNALRKIGFYQVIVMLPFWDGFLPSLASDIAPKTIFCTQESEPNSSYRAVGRLLSLIRRHSFRKIFKFIKVVSFYDKNKPPKCFSSDVWKHVYFISQVLCDLDPRNKSNLNEEGLLPVDHIGTEIESGIEKVKAVEGAGHYCVIGLGSSSPGRNWNPKNFGEVAEFLSGKGLDIVLVGGPESMKLAEGFRESYRGKFINLINKTTLDELCCVIKNSFLMVGNNTSFIHIAIAFKKPMICVCPNEGIGVDSHYGYEDINKWVMADHISDIGTGGVIKEVGNLLDYIKGNPNVPREDFKTSFFDNE
jgi:hypothetical protein